MADHADCPATLRAVWVKAAAIEGSEPIEITVSTEPPIVANPYSTGIECPHGTTYWIEPTGDQIAKWHRDGTR